MDSLLDLLGAWSKEMIKQETLLFVTMGDKLKKAMFDVPLPERQYLKWHMSNDTIVDFIWSEGEWQRLEAIKDAKRLGISKPETKPEDKNEIKGGFRLLNQPVIIDDTIPYGEFKVTAVIPTE